MSRVRMVWTVVSVAWLTGSRLACAQFPHQTFNTSLVAGVQMCKGDFVRNKATQEMEAVELEDCDIDGTLVAALHAMAKSEHCAVPHVKGRGPKLCVLAYLDKSAAPLALIQLWPDGVYYIYEGYRNETGKLCKGRAKGNHGGCSCGKNPDLAKVASGILDKRSGKRSAE